MLKLARRARGHFMTLIEIRVHLIRCKPGHISDLYGKQLLEGKLCLQYPILLQFLKFHTVLKSRFVPQPFFIIDIRSHDTVMGRAYSPMNKSIMMMLKWAFLLEFSQ